MAAQQAEGNHRNGCMTSVLIVLQGLENIAQLQELTKTRNDV
jgi:hypothetical protein